VTRPVIGISTYVEPASWSSWDRVAAALLPQRYVEAVRAGGASVLLLPPLGIDDDPAALLSRLDGLVIAGGADVNPVRYGELAGPATAGWRDDRDVSELALLDAAADLDLPVLGICRGMQLLAVHAGGRLHQHVPDRTGTERHSPGPGLYGPNEVDVAPGTRLAGILGGHVTVPCHHHQSVAEHPGFVPAAWCTDGVLEAMEQPGARFVVGVQWHPETDDDRRLFRALAAACGARV
jgi:putative glutamine amidotransferase